jgi:hypothetical protein
MSSQVIPVRWLNRQQLSGRDGPQSDGREQAICSLGRSTGLIAQAPITRCVMVDQLGAFMEQQAVFYLELARSLIGICPQARNNHCSGNNCDHYRAQIARKQYNAETIDRCPDTVRHLSPCPKRGGPNAAGEGIETRCRFDREAMTRTCLQGVDVSETGGQPH